MFNKRKRLLDSVKELANRGGVSQGGRIPVDNKSKVDPAIVKKHATGNGSRVEARGIGVAAFGIGAHAQRQGTR